MTRHNGNAGWLDQGRSLCSDTRRDNAKIGIKSVGVPDCSEEVHLPYRVKGTDTSGTLSLQRETAEGAQKKAAELTADGCWDVQIEAPDGHVYDASAFDPRQVEMAARPD